MFKHDWVVVAMVTNLVLQAETAKTNADHTYQIITEAARKEVNTSSLFHNQLSLYSCNMIASLSLYYIFQPVRWSSSRNTTPRCVAATWFSMWSLKSHTANKLTQTWPN